MNTAYSSLFAAFISGLVATKRAVGYAYETAEFYLHDFDRYAARHPAYQSLGRELVHGWAKAKDGENPAVHRARISPIRELGKYMQSLGVADAFVLPTAGIRSAARYVPHFFTEQEITAFFGACDKLQPRGAAQARHLVLPVFFRLLYCCGLRTCEARTLRVEQVDLQTGHIDIMRSKGSRSRRIPVPDDVLGLLCRYAARVSEVYPGRIYFFPTTRSDCYSCNSVAAVFNSIWKAAGLGAGCGNRPRAYDFRHHFALSNLNRWIATGVEANAMLPYLSRYMGHASLASTDYYLHLVPEFFATFAAKVKATEAVLPEVDHDQE